VHSFGVRVTDRGHKTYIMYRRWPGSRTATRREIFNADEITLKDARDIAREWLAKVARGIDPQAEKRQRDTEEKTRAERERESTFAKAAEAWFVHITPQRKAYALAVAAAPTQEEQLALAIVADQGGHISAMGPQRT
jgi:hypothetical protein